MAEVMDWLFGKVLTPQEIMKENQNLIRKSIREIERERKKMENQETKLINDMKKTAATGQMGAVRVMALDLVRTRKHVQKMAQMKTRLQAVSLRLQSVQSQATMASAMKGVTRAMGQMNRQINLPGLQQIMMEFEKQSQIMEMKDEVIQDTMEDMWDDEGEEEETDDIVNQVLDEIGIHLETELSTTGPGKVTNTVSTSSTKVNNSKTAVSAGVDDSEDRILQDRLNNLRI
jgi:charged multivesicular body protein 2A